MNIRVLTSVGGVRSLVNLSGANSGRSGVFDRSVNIVSS